VHVDRELGIQEMKKYQISICALLGTDASTVIIKKSVAEEVKRFNYLPFGFLFLEEGQRLNLAFNGQYLERLMRCYLLGNGYRAFNAVLMRFMSPDSWSPFARGGINGYVYCGDDPVNRHDPSGHFDSLRLRYMSETAISKRWLKRFDTNRATQEFSGFWRKKAATVEDFVMADKLGRRLDHLNMVDKIYRADVEEGRTSRLAGLERDYNKVKGKVDRTRQRLSYLRDLYEPITFTVLTPSLQRRASGRRPAVGSASTQEDSLFDQTSHDWLDPSPPYDPPPAYSDLSPLGKNIRGLEG
jgi:RHS repeat-associated protein